MSAYPCRVCNDRVANGPMLYCGAEFWSLCEFHAGRVIETLMDDAELEERIRGMIESMRTEVAP